MEAVEGLGERVAVGGTAEPLARGEAPDPSAGRGPTLGEVVLPPVDDLALVVAEVLALGDREHGRLPARQVHRCGSC
jgi:hypothetical protein